VRLASTLLKDEESARDNHIVACNFAKYSDTKKIHCKLSSKPFLIWLLTTPPHLKYVAILPCNLLFSDINVSKVVWQRNERNGGIFNNQFTANIPMNLAVKIF